jgi:hypothetical protein
MMRAALSALSLAALFAVAPTPVRAQETAVRFPVVDVADTTFTFRVGGQQWVRPGLRGIVVDPRQRDVLVARFRVSSVGGEIARAVITGQATTVNTMHTVLLDVPQKPWYRQRTFWLGSAAGAVVGFLIGGL